MSNNLYRQERFLLMTLDPVHVGTGGNRLGRVDNSIVREPGTRLPKIPGTSLSGAIRQYAAFKYESPRCAGAGQNKDEDKNHCKSPTCPICYTFGYLKGQDGGQSGVVNIGDARIILFPVHSLAGPVWITSPDVLNEFQVSEPGPGDSKVKLPPGLNNHQHLNLGWLMLEKAVDSFVWPDTIKGVPAEIKNRAVLVSNKLFSQIVNSNLEVRTSVSINPETGAASDKALFTYEAIPRATILWLDVVHDNLGDKPFPSPELLKQWNDGELSEQKRKRLKDDFGWQDPYVTLSLTSHQPKKVGNSPLEVVQSGLTLAEYLGVGGMGTRGFGRIKLEAHWEVRS